MSAGRAPAVLCAVLLLILALTGWSAEVPYLTGRVVDDAEVISADARARITRLLTAHEAATGEQVAVLTVQTLGGTSVEEFALAVFDSWKLGQKGRDNGVLVLVVPTERRMRIEVGYGLEGQLTDVHASRIIRNVMTPRFKSGDFDGGIEAGIQAILSQLKGEPVADADDSAPGKSQDTGFQSGFEEPQLTWAERILFGAFIFGIIGLFTIVGVVTPGSGWFLYLFLIPFWAMFPIAVVGIQGALILLVTYLIGYPIAKLIVSRTSWYERSRREIATTGSTRFGGMHVGGSSGSWGSGRSGGSGGFSGGGGSSGGGGASGSW